MALIDNPKDWILLLFRQQARREKDQCLPFPEGTRPAALPLAAEEKVYGVYRQKYYFSPLSLFIVEAGGVVHVRWDQISRCSSEHGTRQPFSTLMLTDGRQVEVPDLASGWTKISQLFHQLIERYGARAFRGRPLVPADEFLARPHGDVSWAVNLEPQLERATIEGALRELEGKLEHTRCYFSLVQEQDEDCADAIVVATTATAQAVEELAAPLRADGVLLADDNTARKLGALPAGYRVYLLPWD